ncbi:MAG TPA: DNA repair protein RadC [Planctomycetota bacterium]|nr:DNA repair protein RadC [Planctomycetota bacterium]
MSQIKPAQFLKEIQRVLRAEAGKALPPLLKRWRYTQSSDFGELPLKPGTRRFLVRFGMLDGGREAAELTEHFHERLKEFSRISGDAPGIVAAWLELFAEGEYNVLKEGICAAEPRCGVCPLKESCRFIASGATDARSFGDSLAASLLDTGPRTRGDLRLSDMLAFLLFGERCGATDIARIEAALKTCNGLRGLFQARQNVLVELGFSAPARSRLSALADTCRLWAEEKAEVRRAFSSGKDFYEHYHLRLRDKRNEVFIVVLLDNKNRLIHDEQVSEGSLTETLVHPREVFANAIACRAAAVALIHNHPSGDPAPSAADKALTKRLQSVAQLVGIRLLDHVIIGDGAFTSFVDCGLLG